MTNEVFAFCASILCGMFCTALWSVFEALRHTLNCKVFLNAVLDVVWWLAVCVIFCMCMWQTVNMNLRAFEFLGMAIGAFFCHITLAKPIKYVFGLCFSIILKIIRFIFKILLTPGAFLYKILLADKMSKLRLKSRKVAKNDSPKKQNC